jgi:multidrug resistance efflux pump
MNRKRSLTIATALLVVIGLFFFLPVPYSHQGTFVIEPSEVVPVRTQTEGFVGGVLVQEGDAVNAGTLLAVMRDIDLEQRLDSLRTQISVIERNVLIQRAHANFAEAIQSNQEGDALRQEMAQREAQLAGLKITSPVEGVVITPNVDSKAGCWLKKGAELCRLAPDGSLRARVVVDDWDLQDVQVGSTAVLRMNAGGPQIRGQVMNVAPASQLHQRLSPVVQHDKEENSNTRGGSPDSAKKKNSEVEQLELAADQATSPYEAPLVRFDALIQFDDVNDRLKPGMSGDVKIYGQSRPLAFKIGRGLRNWFRSKIWW